MTSGYIGCDGDGGGEGWLSPESCHGTAAAKVHLPSNNFNSTCSYNIRSEGHFKNKDKANLLNRGSSMQPLYAIYVHAEGKCDVP